MFGVVRYSPCAGRSYDPNMAGVRRRSIIFVGALGAAVLAACGPSTTAPAHESASSSASSTPSAGGAEVPTAAERVLRSDFQLGPDEPFAMYQCHSTGELCWLQYINGFTFDSGQLGVALQVDRASADGKKTAERAAIAIRNLLGADHDPALKQVQGVVITDGTGVEIAHQAMR